MGYTQWRERTLARIDGVADRLERSAAESSARADAMSREREAQRSASVEEARDEWGHRRAQQLGEDHDDLAARAGALGIPAPAPDRQMRGRVFAALGELAVMDGAGVEGGTVDAYQAWRDRIVVEESMVAKQARGESLSLMDRAALKLARRSSR